MRITLLLLALLLVLPSACAWSTGAIRRNTDGVDGIDCESPEDCEEHQRECREGWKPCCPGCSGTCTVCEARTAEAVAALDKERERCGTMPDWRFSYSSGCVCSGEDCPSPEEQCEEAGGYYSEIGCIVGTLGKPPETETP